MWNGCFNHVQYAARPSYKTARLVLASLVMLRMLTPNALSLMISRYLTISFPFHDGLCGAFAPQVHSRKEKRPWYVCQERNDVQSLPNGVQ